ncbi:zinc finger MYM-type protein 1-like [Dysidea avara]|uniref:zinc finger MYM-type protein 1-like n=1 Tax=Dysidea avara TaxID=196820 RepID=UPI00332A9C6E
MDFKTKHRWLSFDSQKKGAYCKVCQKFYSGERGLPKGSDGVFITKPFIKWSKATGSTKKNNRLLKHQESQAHKLAISQAELCENMTCRGSVYTQLYSRGASDSDRCLNLMMLCKYIKIVYWRLKHEIAHTTNYQSLIELCTECDESGNLARWQQQRPDNATYTSSATSAEMIKAVSQYFDEKNTENFLSSPVLSLMCDESTDLRNRTELSVCVRYLTDAGTTIESFVEIAPICDAKAETITDKIVSILESHHVDFSKIMWLAFDGANNMCGHKTGVFARLKAEKCPEAEYVHYRSHLLQLACINACEKLKPIKSLFSAINSLYRLFSMRPKRAHALKEVQEALQDPSLSLLHAGDTRWTSHYRSVKAVVKCLRSIITTLQHLHQVSDLLEAALARPQEVKTKQEYLTAASEFFTDSGMLFLDNSQMSNDQIHSNLCLSDLKDEWKTFYNYLKLQSSKDNCPSGNEILQKLATNSGDLGDAFSQLSTVSKIILVCPLGAASVERSFSTMA